VVGDIGVITIFYINYIYMTITLCIYILLSTLVGLPKWRIRYMSLWDNKFFWKHY